MVTDDTNSESKDKKKYPGIPISKEDLKEFIFKRRRLYYVCCTFFTFVNFLIFVLFRGSGIPRRPNLHTPDEPEEAYDCFVKLAANESYVAFRIDYSDLDNAEIIE